MLKSVLISLSILCFTLIISCTENKSTEPVNNAPEILNISANPAIIKVNETTTLSCTAIDNDSDNLNYSWSSDQGTFLQGADDSLATWKGPDTEGTYHINVAVSDGVGTDTDEVEVIVETSGGGNTGNPCSGISSVTYEGKTYNTVEIGSQCWLKENLDIGTMITVNSAEDSQTDNGIVEKYCYDNNSANCDEYGGLYQWNEAMQYSNDEGTQGICPDGWHIPTSLELVSLRDEVNGDANALKAIGQGSGSGTGTNTSGFSALIAGRYDITWHFLGLSTGAFYAWSSTVENINDLPDNLFIEEYHGNISFRSNRKSTGYSIRCLKD